MIFNVFTGTRLSPSILIRNATIVGVAVLLGTVVGILTFNSQSSALGVLTFCSLALLVYFVVQRPINGLLLWLFFMPFIETYIKIDLGRGIPAISFSRFAVALLLVVMLFLAIQDRFEFRPLSLSDLLILLVPVGIVFAAPLSDDPIAAAQRTISNYFTPIAVYFFGKHLVKSKQDIKLVLWALVALGFFAGIAAVSEFFTGQAFFVPAEREVTRLYRGETDLRLISSILGSTGAMGRVLGSLLPIAVYLALEAKQSTVRILLFTAIVVISSGLLVTLSRTPILASVLAVFILQFAYPRFRQLFVVFGLVAAVAIGANWSSIQATELAEDRLAGVEDFNGRAARWEAGYNMWLARPVRGWGYEAFAEQSGNFRSDGRATDFDAVESEYIFLLVSTGLIGFLPFAMFLLVPLLTSLRLFRRARAPDWEGIVTPQLIILYWAVLLTLFVAMTTAVSSNSVVKLIPFAVAGAVIGSQEHWLQRSKKELDDNPVPAAA